MSVVHQGKLAENELDRKQYLLVSDKKTSAKIFIVNKHKCTEAGVLCLITSIGKKKK